MNIIVAFRKITMTLMELLLIALPIASTSLADNGTTLMTQQPTEAITNCGANPPASSGFEYAPFSGAESAITSAQAIQTAIPWAGVPVDSNTEITAHMVMFTANNYTFGGIPDSDYEGIPLHQNIPAYVVSFCNVSYPISVPMGVNTEMFSREVNIVINANTGEPVSRFTWR